MSQVTEQELLLRSVAPRVTLEQLEVTIASKHFFTAADGVDGAALKDMRASNAYESVCFSPKAFDNGIEGTPTADLSLLTFCVLRLKNGFIVHGVSACASPANYNRDIGERIAYENARNQLWPLLGYELKSQLYQASLYPAQGADLPEGSASEPQASAAGNPEGAGEATGV